MIFRSLVYCVVVRVIMIIVYLHYSHRPLNDQLYWAIHEGHTEEVFRLLEEGADPNWQNVDGRTALHMACFHNHHLILSVLINSNANINIKDGNTYTPLHWACRYGYFKCVSLLVGAGCHSG